LKLEWEHSCGKIFTSQISERGLRKCPRCSSGSSTAEREIGDILEQRGERILRRDRSLGFEVDIYLPDRKIAIEYDGTYWHSTLFEDEKKCTKKLERATKAGIRLITVQEHCWAFEREKVLMIF
jgi:G:T-mismatch repair DNA endonuclease (very short patch repair protein)